MESTIVMRSVSALKCYENNQDTMKMRLKKWQNQLKSSVFSANSN